MLQQSTMSHSVIPALALKISIEKQIRRQEREGSIVEINELYISSDYFA